MLTIIKISYAKLKLMEFTNFWTYEIDNVIWVNLIFVLLILLIGFLPLEHQLHEDRDTVCLVPPLSPWWIEQNLAQRRCLANVCWMTKWQRISSQHFCAFANGSSATGAPRISLPLRVRHLRCWQEKKLASIRPAVQGGAGFRVWASVSGSQGTKPSLSALHHCNLSFYTQWIFRVCGWHPRNK